MHRKYIHTPPLASEITRNRCSVVFLSLQEGVGYLPATVDGADDDEEGATHDDKAEGSGCVVSFFVCYSTHAAY